MTAVKKRIIYKNGSKKQFYKQHDSNTNSSVPMQHTQLR